MFLRTLLALTLGVGSPAVALALDTELYGRLLAEHTREVTDTAGTRVAYAKLARSSEWKQLVSGLSSAKPSRARRDMAFWINAYNILAIDTVVRNYPVDSIRDVGSFFSPVWDHDAGKIGGRPHTLGEIEHQILRPLGDPRIHAAIVCASTSCPSLRREPYTDAKLDAQLDDAVRVFLANTEKGLRVDPAADRVILSKIFSWFDEDFADAGGVLSFVTRHAPPESREWLERSGADATVEYFDYDWKLNGS